jgi:FkbM family methyltransferase
MTPSDEAATEADIAACFRLLLGRAPTDEEWVGYCTLLGQPVGAVVRAFVESKEYAARARREGSPEGGLRLTQKDGFKLYTDDTDLAVGRHVAGGVYEPEIAAQLQAHVRPGMTMLDVGANIGLFTMLGASLVGPAGFVLAVEPNPENVRLIEASRRANGFAQVSIAACAVGRSVGVLELESTYSNGMTSEPGESLQALFAARLVPSVPLARLLPERRIDFIKIDCEGAEYTALSSIQAVLRRDRPVIVSEFNPRLLEPNSGVSGAAYLALLAGLGYRMGVIKPDGVVPCADGAAVLAIQAENAPHHVDILATPVRPWWRIGSRRGRA